MVNKNNNEVKGMKKKIILMVIAAFCAAVLTGCHTLHGFGKDVENAGEAIERAAD